MLRILILKCGVHHMSLTDSYNSFNKALVEYKVEMAACSCQLPFFTEWVENVRRNLVAEIFPFSDHL